MSINDEKGIIRSMIQHEDLLRDQRLGWLLALNGFLFTALAFAWNDSAALAYILAVLGVLIAISGFATLRVSDFAIKRLRDLAQAMPGATPVVGLTSEVLKDSPNTFDHMIPGFYLWVLVPIGLAAAWAAVILVRAFD
jgi:hypothetical protein